MSEVGKSEKELIAAAVSKLAKTAPNNPDESIYQEEKNFAASLSVQNRKRGFFARFMEMAEGAGVDLKETPKTVREDIQEQNEWQDLKEKEDAHTFRKVFLILLFVLVCTWLGIVVYFVYDNAVSPSMEDRSKLIQIQQEIVSEALDGTNSLDSTMIKIATPIFHEHFFHLSDSVLIAFITSTTVAVLGLFVTAANWLFKKKDPKNFGKESK